MIAKFVIVVLVIGMLAALTLALKQLLSPNRDSQKLLNALTWRISIWVFLLAFIVVAVQLKWITPSETLMRRVSQPTQIQN